MSGKVTRRDFKTASWSKLRFTALGMALCATLFLSCMTSTAQAAIVATGDVNPADPATWTASTFGHIGKASTGTILVNDGSCLVSKEGHIGDQSTAVGSVTITGADSQWTNSTDIIVGYSGKGTLNIQAGAQVGDDFSVLGNSSGSTGTVNVTGIGSKWTHNSNLYVGYSGSGTLNIEAGGQVSSMAATLGRDRNKVGTVTITGTGSSWINKSSIQIGFYGCGKLNIGSGIASGGLVKTESMILSYSDYFSIGSCTINGGTLQTKVILDGGGTSAIYWKDGTIQNFDANTDLHIYGNLELFLSSTGTHSFMIDGNRTATVDAALRNETTGGTLTKQGEGLLTLTGVNTYSGKTTVEAGRFKVTGSILKTNGVDVSAGATLELAKTAGSATAGSLAIDNAGMILILAGSQTVGTISGTGVTQVIAGTLTAKSIVQNSLSIGTTGAVGIAGNTIGQVPEPGTIALLLLGAIGTLFAWVWRR